MSRFLNLPFALQESVRNHSLLKVISGLNNFDKNSILKTAIAAREGSADLLDVACDPELVRSAIEVSGLPICVSAIEPALFANAISAGASMIEIGNFDSFYLKGRYFEASEVLALTTETRKLYPDIFLSVTVPHSLPLDKQSQLAFDLVEIGADMIQTEGGTSSTPLNAGSLGLIEKAAPTLAASHSIVESFERSRCEVPVICASGLSVVTIPMALSVGASGVGVGSAVNRLSNEVEMIAMVKNLRESMNSYKSIIIK